MLIRLPAWPLIALATLLIACESPTREIRTPTTLRLSEAALTLADGDSARITAAVLDQTGAALDTARSPIQWVSSDPEVATFRGGWVIANSPGVARLTASSGTLTAEVLVTVAQVPRRLEKRAGDDQSVRPEAVLPDSLEVQVLDRHGSPVPDVPVAFAVVEGGGMLSAGSVTSDGQGLARVAWRLGPLAGTQRVRASAAGDTVIFVATAAARTATTVRITPTDIRLPLGDTIRLGAEVLDEEGAPIEGAPVTWVSSDTTIASVTPNGLVHGRGPGTATVSAIFSETVRASVTITVIAPPAPSCGPGTARALQVGEAITAEGPEAATFCVAGDAEYVLVPFFASGTSDATLALQVVAQGVVAVTGPPTPARLASSASLKAPAVADLRFERRLREREIRELGPRIQAARTRISVNRPTTSLALSVPQEGDLLPLNVSTRCDTESLSIRTGRVVAVTQRAIVVADTANPAGGLTDAEYRSFGVAFDTLAYPVNVENFDEPTDIDANQRAIIFYTRAVNELTEPGSQSFVGGFFWAGDLFPKAECAGSNQAEMFYMLVPDPEGKVNNNVRSRDLVIRSTVGVIAHEFQHLINAGRRIYVNSASTLEEVWLNEALSHIAEELLFYRVGRIEPRRNLTLEDVRASQTVLDALNRYQVSNLARFRTYLENPDTAALMGVDHLPTRGASWAFLRYAADRETGDDAAFFKALVNSRTRGIPNLQNVLGVDPIDWMQHWTASVYADDAVPGVLPRYLQPSWNFRSLMPAITASGNFPLRVTHLQSDGAVPLRLRAGGAAFLRFGGAPGGAAEIRTSSGGASPPTTFRATILRTR